MYEVFLCSNYIRKLNLAQKFAFFVQIFYLLTMGIIINLLLSSIAVIISAYILPGVHVANFLTAVVVAIVLGIINAVIKPVLLILTLPINILTLGIFTFIINGLLILLVSSLVQGFRVDNFWWAVLFSIILSIVNAFFSSLKNS